MGPEVLSDLPRIMSRSLAKALELRNPKFALRMPALHQAYLTTVHYAAQVSSGPWTSQRLGEHLEGWLLLFPTSSQPKPHLLVIRAPHLPTSPEAHRISGVRPSRSQFTFTPIHSEFVCEKHCKWASPKVSFLKLILSRKKLNSYALFMSVIWS